MIRVQVGSLLEAKLNGSSVRVYATHKNELADIAKELMCNLGAWFQIVPSDDVGAHSESGRMEAIRREVRSYGERFQSRSIDGELFVRIPHKPRSTYEENRYRISLEGEPD